MNKVFRILAAICAAVLLSASASAQTAATGNIEGVVTDATGAVLPGVTVVIKNTETNVAREVVTDNDGRYRASALQPGTYEVTATLTGFQALPLSKTEVLVGQTVAVDVRMRPAGVTEQVTVTGESPAIDTSRTDVSNVVGEKAIENLPINGRRWENFVLLGPGVTNDGTFGLVSYRGISGLYNNNTIDGVDNNQALFSEARGRTRASYSVSQAAIREFAVGVSNFSAEFGRAAGGTVNAVTKSGTNQFRGEGFYFLRHHKFMAKEPFAPFKPDEKRQQFGVSTGGPLVRDKTFFFGNFDQQLRNFPGYTRPFLSTFFDSACSVPGCGATIAYLKSLNTFWPREGNNRIFLGKVDHVLSPGNNLTVQYNMHRWDSPSGQETRQVVTVAYDAVAKDIVKTDFAVATLNSVLSQRWLNEARFQYGRDFEAQIPNGLPPSTTVTNGIDFGMANFLPRPKYPDERRVQVIDNVTWYRGAHSLKTGVDVNYVSEGLINLFQGGGVYAYTGSSLQNLASDCPAKATGCVPVITGAASDLRHYSTYTQAFDLRGSGLRGDADFSTTDFNWFAQDNWKVTNQLTVNLGLRYEYQKLPQPGDAGAAGVKFTGNPAYPATTRFHQDKNNWGPRAGFTYDFGAAHQTVVRGGYGIYYGRSSNSLLFTALTQNAVTFATYQFTPSSPGAPQYPSVFSAPPSGTGTKPTIQYLSPGLQRPEIYSGELTLDRAIPYDVTVSASYLYSRGKHLPTFTDTNLPAPSATVAYVVGGENRGTFPFYRGSRPDPNINGAIEVIDSVESWYHALVLQANKRFTRGLLFNANYTLSKSEDSGQNSTTFIPTSPAVYDPQNLGFEKGISNTDRRHRFVLSVHYAPSYLWGVQLGGIGTFESGLPTTATISGSIAGTTGAIQSNSTNGSGGSNRSPFDERNGFRQPGRKTIDLRVSKAFNVGGRRQLIALWEGFNVFNTVNYTSFTSTKYTVASSSYDAATNTTTVNLNQGASFLVPSAASSTLFGPRDMQIGLRFLW